MSASHRIGLSAADAGHADTILTGRTEPLSRSAPDLYN